MNEPAEQFRKVVIPYKPRELMLPYHRRKQRWSITVAHRRFGKTVAAINDLVMGALTCELEDPRFAYIAPTYSQAKDVAWVYLKRFGLSVPGAIPNESELRVDFPNGGRVRLYGSDNYDRMRGIYLDGVVPDEYGDQDPRSWTEVIRPALSDRKGWASFIGTPKGANHFKDLWDKAAGDEEWFRLMLKASETGILDADELRSARSMMTEEQYQTEYECSFLGSVVGSYYGKALRDLEDQAQVGDFPWLSGHAVHTVWDVGGTGACWFFQIINDRVRIIDYMEGDNKGIDWYVTELRSRPYTYGSHIGPFDADVKKEIVGKSWKTSFEELGIHGWIILPQQKSKIDGINQARLMVPMCQFNIVGGRNCSIGYTGLQNYRREWDDKRKMFREEPYHNWASHPADGFRYLAVGKELITGLANATDWSKPIKYKAKFT